MLPNTRAIIARFARRLAWLTMTPFGAEVEPEVYCRNAMSTGPVGRGAGMVTGAAWSTRVRHRPPPETRCDLARAHCCCRETGGQIAALAVDQRARRQREARRAVGDDGGAGVAGAVAARHHHRHRRDPGQHAAEKPDHKADAVRAE